MSAADKPHALLAIEYGEYAQAYLHSLPLEHFAEAPAQGTQRKITLESLDLVHPRRLEVQVFNELLIQYPRPRQRKPGQVVPDNMLVLWKEPIKPDLSYDIPLQPVGPFWVLDYVSKHNQRKDYQDNFQKYEQELKVPYYLVFYPDNQELTLYHHTGRKYRAVPPDEQGRHPIPELDLEVGLEGGWVRYWYRGKLLPLPADLQRDLEEAQRRAKQAQRRAEHERRRAEQEKRRAEQAQRRAEAAARRSKALEERLKQEEQARRTLERELEVLRARLAESEPRPPGPP